MYLNQSISSSYLSKGRPVARLICGGGSSGRGSTAVRGQVTGWVKVGARVGRLDPPVAEEEEGAEMHKEQLDVEEEVVGSTVGM